MAPPSPKEDQVTVEEHHDTERRLIALPSSVVEQLHLLDEVKELASEAIELGKASRSTSVTKNDPAPNGNEDASKAKKNSSKTTKPTRRSKQQRDSEKIDTNTKENEEKEDRQPIAVINCDNSQSKKSEKGESSTKTSKKRKSHSEIIDTAIGMKTELDTEVNPKKRVRKPNSLIKPEEGYFHSWGGKYLEISQLKRSSKKKGGNTPKNSASKDNSAHRSKKKTHNLSEEMSPMEKCVTKEESVRNQDGKVDSVHVSEDDEKVTDSFPKTKRNKEGSRQHGEASKVKRKSLSTELKEAPKKTHVVKNRGKKLVGRKIKIWWPEDSEFYLGEITSFDRAANKYQVLYRDRDVEMLDLKNERWELLKDGEEIISGSKAPVDMVIPESETITKVSESTGIVVVKGYKVRASVAPTLEDVFNKYGDIISQCPYKSALVKASLLEIVCDTVQRLHSDNSAPDLNEVESVINDAEEAKLDIGWLRVELEKRRVAEEAEQKGAMLRETKMGIVRAAKAAKFDLEHRKAELAAAQKKVEEAEKCFEVLKCVKRKVEADILENEALGKKRSKLL